MKHPHERLSQDWHPPARTDASCETAGSQIDGECGGSTSISNRLMPTTLLATAGMRLVAARGLLSRAKTEIEKGEASLRAAAEYMAQAQALGASQRDIAAAVGKSVGWVNGF